MSKSHDKHYTIWCDGSYSARHQVGAWGAIIITPDGSMEEQCGQIPVCKNSHEAEVWSMIESLRYIPDNGSVQIFSDCTTAIDIVTDCIKPIYSAVHIKNPTYPQKTYPLEIVRWLDRAYFRLGEIQLCWVKAHNNIEMNNRAHRLALFKLREQTEPLKNLAKKRLEANAYHAKSYVDSTSRAIRRLGFLMKSGDAQKIVYLLCQKGILDASNPYQEDEGLPLSDSILTEFATKFKLRKVND